MTRRHWLRVRVAATVSALLATLIAVSPAAAQGPFDLGTACSDGEEICKEVTFEDANGNGLIELGEEVSFTVEITVTNASASTWADVVVKDNFGAEIEVHGTTPSTGTVDLRTTGKSEKVHLTWTIGDLAPGASATLVIGASTDQNPAGHQEYTECGVHDFNSGAVLKFAGDSGRRSFGTGSISLRVWCAGVLFAGSDTEEFAGVPLPDRLAVMTTIGPVVTSLVIGPAEVYTNGIEHDGAGTLFAGDPLTSAQNVIETDGDLVSAGVGPLPPVCCNEDIAFDGTDLWRANWFGGPLFRYQPNGVVTATYDQTDVVGATFVGSTLWLTKWGAQQVGTFDPATNTFTPVFSTAPNNAGGLAYDAANNLLWVGRQGGQVEAYDLTTSPPTLIPGSGTQPFGAIGDTIDGVAFIGN